MSSSSHRFGYVGLAVLIAIVLSMPLGLSFVADASDPWQAEETVLRIGSLERVESLNPYLGLNKVSSIFYGLVYDCLQGVGNGLEFTPNLAKGCWVVPLTDPDMVMSGEPYGSVWQYNLTHNAFWTDGEPFTADDVVFNININAMYHRDLWMYTQDSYFLSYAEKIDTFTVRVHFYDRATDAPIPVAFGSAIQIPMLPRHILDLIAPAEIGFGWQGVPVVGTGPFMAGENIYDEWLIGDSITLFRNPDYHGLADYGQLVHFDEVQLQYFYNSTVLEDALESGSIDIAILPTSSYLGVKSLIDGGTLHDVVAFDGLRPDNYFTYILTNMKNAGPNPSRLDPAVREALAMATNKTYIVGQFYHGLGEEGSTLISPANEAWHCGLAAGEEYEYDLVAAAALLESAGYRDTNEDGIRECTASSLAVQENWVNEGVLLVYEMLVRREYPEERAIAEHLKATWANIGVVLDYEVLDEAELGTLVYYYEYDTAIWCWDAGVDPNSMLWTQTESAWSGWSDTLYYSPAYEWNYSASVSALDYGERKSYVDACQLIHYTDCPYIILTYPDQTVAWRTDTFAGWGDWAANPGRSVFSTWGGNPLYFDLIPLTGENTPPSITSLAVGPNPAEPSEAVSFVVSAFDVNSDPLVVTVEFGDGDIAVETTAGGTPLTQTAVFNHAYASPGLYSVRVWANDSYGPATHNDTVYYENRVVVCVEGELGAHIDPSPVVLDAGDAMSLTVHVDFPYASETEFSGIRYLWSVDPDSMGSFDRRGSKTVNFTAGPVGANGVISCALCYYEAEIFASAELTIVPPCLSWVSVVPSAALMRPMTSMDFSAQAYDNLGCPIPGLEYVWTVEGMTLGDYMLNSTIGRTVMFVPLVEGAAWLNATTSSGESTQTGAAFVLSSYSGPERTVDYRWYDMFNVPFGEWWDMRAIVGQVDIPLSHEYPYLFQHDALPYGDVDTCSNMRLDVTARNLTEISMAENPEFLPMHGPGSGGNAVIDWYMQYLTSEEMERLPQATEGWSDGWVVSLNGTVTLDEQAALSVLLDFTPEGFDDFSAWWALHGSAVELDFADWFKSEAGKDRLDIYPMYDYFFTTLSWDLSAEKVGDKIVLGYDLVSWGMESLIARWLSEAFMPTEWYFEDMDLHADIGPIETDLDISTAVAYAVYAWEATIDSPEPCWVWEAMRGDYIEAYPPDHKESEFNPYADEERICRSPGSLWYGEMAPYDYTPGAWNLSEGETLTLEWPAGDQMFKVHIDTDLVLNVTSEMTVKYAEPIDYDNSDLAPGSVSTDIVGRKMTYTGPIDMWEWSRLQNEVSHSFLADEWDRLGLLPRGAPYVEFSPGALEGNLFLEISDVPFNPVMGAPSNITVSALDMFGDPWSDYDGTVTFSTDRPGEVTLPADYAFTVEDAGSHTFVSGVTFHATGWFMIMCSDAFNESVFDAYLLVYVLSEEPVLDHLRLALVPAIDPIAEDTEVSVMVTACDVYGVTIEDYVGTVSFLTDAAPGTYALPADHTFSLSDAGVAILPGLLYEDPGSYELVAYDTASFLGDSLYINVTSLSQQIDYRMYDMFKQPWGEWWNYRLPVYKTDIILCNETDHYTMVYNPDMRGRQGIIMAPYRWNVSADNVPTVSVDDPAIMPVFGPIGIEGASAHLDVYFEYLDQEWWDNYWIPTWKTDNPDWTGTHDSIIVSQAIDGYYLGTVYTATMNREAAETWLNMPREADPLSWWALNKASYIESWDGWIDYQGNVEYDIYAGYEWAYVPIATLMKLEVEGDDIVLRIAHFNWGYEVLMTRWMTDRAICTHEPMMEDFQLSAQLEPGHGDLTYDAVAQWNLHAVKANKTESDAAWVWEPQHIDYLSWDGSEFNPWVPLQYTSWNSGDMFFGDYVGYDFTPTVFDLTEYMSLVIQLPLGNNVIGYRGLPTPYGSITLLKTGNDSAYENITLFGPMWFEYHLYPDVPGAPDLSSMYDNVSKTLTLEGPMSFDNYRQQNESGVWLLYHSAPWLEFNVANFTWPHSEVTGLTIPGGDTTVVGESSMSLATMALALMLSIVATDIVVAEIRRRED